jgi:hypothetical protein
MANLTPDQIRAKVLADPNTAKIAAELRVPLEEFVQRVVFFATNPDAEPELFVMTDENVKANGGSVPDLKAVVQYLDREYEATNGTQVSRFEQKTNSLPVPPAPRIEASQVKTDLQNDIAKEIKRPTKI